MSALRFGQIVLLNFPFTDGSALKRRLALVIRDTGDGYVIVCRITSKIHSTVFDIEIEDWAECGLRLPSVIRAHKIASLSVSMVGRVMEEIRDSLKLRVSPLLKDVIAG